MNRLTLTERLSASLNLLPGALYDAFPAVLFGRILALASRRGIFELLRLKPATGDNIAGALGMQAIPTKHLLDALSAAGYLRKKGESYRLTRQSSKWLLSSSPHYVGNFLAYLDLLYSHWVDLDQALTSGRPARTYLEIFRDAEWRTYTLGMMDLARLTIPMVIPKLTMPRNATELVDLGGSHGLYAIELCKRYPSLHATIVDLPEVLVTTRDILHEHHFEGRIATSASNITDATFPPESIDVVLAFNIIHGFDEVSNRRLLRKIGAALRPGGMLYILDQIEAEGRRGAGRMIPLLMGIHMLNEIGGTVYTLPQLRSLCTEAGLKQSTLIRLRLPGVSLLCVSKDTISD